MFHKVILCVFVFLTPVSAQLPSARNARDKRDQLETEKRKMQEAEKRLKEAEQALKEATTLVDTQAKLLVQATKESKEADEIFGKELQELQTLIEESRKLLEAPTQARTDPPPFKFPRPQVQPKIPFTSDPDDIIVTPKSPSISVPERKGLPLILDKEKSSSAPATGDEPLLTSLKDTKNTGVSRPSKKTDRSLVTLQVHPEAVVRINGTLMEGRGSVRTFRTPDLEVGRTYEYTFAVTPPTGASRIQQAEITPGINRELDMTK